MTGAQARIWTAALCLAAGTLHGCSGGSSVAAAGVAVLGGGAVLRRDPLVRLVGLAALVAGLGSWAAGARCGHDAALSVIAERVPSCALSGRVLEGAGGLGTLAMIDSARCDGHRRIVNPGVAVLRGEVGRAGFSLEARGWLVPLGDDAFDRALAHAGVHARFDAVHMSVTPPASGPYALAASLAGALDAATTPLDGRRAALLRGLAIGDTGEIDPATTESFRRAGLSHLLAVSGSNVAIVLGVAAWAVRALGLRARVGTGCAALALYVLVVGPEPSVLRAALMGGVSLAALFAGARPEPLAALGLALLVLVALRPGLVYSVGLHLSAAATAGIVLWSEPLGRRLNRLPAAVTAILAPSLAAQAAVAPLIVGVFGEISVTAPMANLVALPAVPPATVLTLSAAIAHTLHPLAGVVLARAGQPFAAWILWAAESFSSASWAAVELPHVAALPLAFGAAAAAWGSLRGVPK